MEANIVANEIKKRNVIKQNKNVLFVQLNNR